MRTQQRKSFLSLQVPNSAKYHQEESNAHKQLNYSTPSHVFITKQQWHQKKRLLSICFTKRQQEEYIDDENKDSHMTSSSITETDSAAAHKKDNNENTSIKSNKEEMETLTERLYLIQAIELRNEAQLGSFIDEQHQWESLEEDERRLLLEKNDLMKRFEEISSFE